MIHLCCYAVSCASFNSSIYEIISLNISVASGSSFGLVRGESKEQTGARHQTLDEWHKAESERLEKELVEMANNVLADEKEIAPQSFESDIYDNLR